MAKRVDTNDDTAAKRVDESAKPDAYPYGFGRTLSTLRAEHLLSQTELGKAIDRSASFISLLEHERRRPNRALIETLATALNLQEDSIGHGALLRSAGYDTGELPSAVSRLAATIGQQHGLGEAQRLGLSADLSALVEGWSEYFTIQTQFDQGAFADATAGCKRLLAQRFLSPSLHNSVRIMYADSLTHMGELESAQREAKDLTQRVKAGEVVPALSLAVEAEGQGLRGLIAVDQGRYTEGVKRHSDALNLYQKLIVEANKPAASEYGVAVSNDVAYIGIVVAYKRLAQAALLQGETERGLTYCVAAESYLSNISDHASDERATWRRRVNELRAWALTRQGDFETAFLLRAQTRAELNTAHDEYGVTRNILYTGNDYLSLINATVRQVLAKPPEGIADGKYFAWRAEQLRMTLQQKRVSDALDTAKTNYEEVLARLEGYSHQLILGQCLRNLAITLRYKALRDEDNEAATAARDMLARALTLEEGIGQPRRIAAVCEALADLDVDEGRYVNAQYYYRLGISRIDTYLGSDPDNAANTQRKRMSDAAEEVEKYIRSLRKPPALSPTVLSPSEEWTALCADLTELAYSLVAAANQPPAANSSRSDEWGRIIYELEGEPGGRRILQNALSDALVDLARAGVSPAGADRHGKRFQLVKDAVMRANTPSDALYDLCCRPYVEKELGFEGTAELTRAQINQALEWMTTYRRYWLESSDYPVPLAFYVKDKHILLEIPPALAPRFLGADYKVQHVGSSLCYDIKENQEGADALRILFDRFVDTAAKLRTEAPNAESTIDWLRRLSGTFMPAPGLVGAVAVG